MRVLFVFVVLLVACGFGGFWWWTTTPQYSIEQVKVAVKSHDLQKFNKYVDVDTASSRMVDDFLDKPMRKVLEPSLIGEVFVAGVIGLFRPHLASGIKHEIISYVESGSFKPSADPSDTDRVAPIPSWMSGRSSVSLDAADSHFGFRAHSFKGVASTQVSGALAQVELLFHNDKYNRDLNLDVQMRKMDGYWQVIELSNFPEFCGKLARLQADNGSSEDQQSVDQVASPQKVTGI